MNEETPIESGRERFPRALRLRRPPEFRAVFSEGRSSSDGRVVVYVRARPEGGPTRLGLAVRRKFGSSPERNLWKRRVREAFRTRYDRLPASHDLVVLPARDGALSGFAELSGSLVRVADRAARLLRKKGPRKRGRR